MARFDGASAKQDTVLPDGQSTNDQTRITVVDGAAGSADMPWQAIARRQAKFDWRAAGAAIIDGWVHGAAILAPSQRSTGAATGWEKRVNCVEYK